MARYRFPAFETSSSARYIVLWDLQWQIIDCQRFEPAADLSGAMTATIERLADEGWQAEATPEYGPRKEAPCSYSPAESAKPC